MARVVFLLRKSLSNGGIGAHIYPSRNETFDSFTFLDASYHDDRVIHVTASASNLTTHLTDASAHIVNIFNMFSSSVNFSPGKTEALTFFAGPHSVSARERLARSDACLHFEVAGTRYGLRCVTRLAPPSPLI